MDGDLLIVGGGAAGMFATATLAEADPAFEITVLERGATPLAKLRRTGGGRCNLTHRCDDLRRFTDSYPRGGRELLGPLHRFGPAETMRWFEARGVPLKTEADGRVFPRSDRSEDVARALLSAAERGRVEIRVQAEVREVGRDGAGYAVTLQDGATVRARRLLWATGGGVFAPGIEHTIVPCVPSLFAVRLDDTAVTALSGVTVESARACALGCSAVGGVLITRDGLSGPAVLRLSSLGARPMAAAGYRFELQVDWIPDVPAEVTDATPAEWRRQAPRRTLGAEAPFGLPIRLWRLALSRAGVECNRTWSRCTTEAWRATVAQLRAFPLAVTGRAPSAEFVTCGGIALNEVDFRTMESRRHPGLYFAGETLDVDGWTGGFNLQAAWTTGRLAAEAIIRESRPDPAHVEPQE